MNTRARAIGWTGGLALLVAVADQAIKRLVTGALLPGESHVVLPGLLNLTYAQNTGAAFSLLHRASPATVLALNLAVLAVFGVLVWPHLRHRWGMAAAVLVVGGALGNIIDRVQRSYVVDYLDIHVWPVFNLADICVVIGVITLGLLVVRHAGSDAAPSGGGETS